MPIIKMLGQLKGEERRSDEVISKDELLAQAFERIYHGDKADKESIKGDNPYLFEIPVSCITGRKDYSRDAIVFLKDSPDEGGLDYLSEEKAGAGNKSEKRSFPVDDGLSVIFTKTSNMTIDNIIELKWVDDLTSDADTQKREEASFKLLRDLRERSLIPKGKSPTFYSNREGGWIHFEDLKAPDLSKIMRDEILSVRRCEYADIFVLPAVVHTSPEYLSRLKDESYQRQCELLLEDIADVIFDWDEQPLLLAVKVIHDTRKEAIKKYFENEGQKSSDISCFLVLAGSSDTLIFMQHESFMIGKKNHGVVSSRGKTESKECSADTESGATVVVLFTGPVSNENIRAQYSASIKEEKIRNDDTKMEKVSDESDGRNTTDTLKNAGCTNDTMYFGNNENSGENSNEFADSDHEYYDFAEYKQGQHALCRHDLGLHVPRTRPPPVITKQLWEDSSSANTQKIQFKSLPILLFFKFLQEIGEITDKSETLKLGDILITFNTDDDYSIYELSVRGRSESNVERCMNYIKSLLSLVEMHSCTSHLVNWAVKHCDAIHNSVLLKEMQKNNTAIAYFYPQPAPASLGSSKTDIADRSKASGGQDDHIAIYVDIISTSSERTRKMLSLIAALTPRNTVWDIPLKLVPTKSHLAEFACEILAPEYRHSSSMSTGLKADTDSTFGNSSVQVWGFDNYPELALESILEGALHPEIGALAPKKDKPDSLSWKEISSPLRIDSPHGIQSQGYHNNGFTPPSSAYNSPKLTLNSSSEDERYFSASSTSDKTFDSQKSKREATEAHTSSCLFVASSDTKIEDRKTLTKRFKHRMSFTFQDREAGIFYQAFETELNLYISHRFNVKIAPLELHEDQCGAGGRAHKQGMASGRYW